MHRAATVPYSLSKFQRVDVRESCRHLPNRNRIYKVCQFDSTNFQKLSRQARTRWSQLTRQYAFSLFLTGHWQQFKVNLARMRNERSNKAMLPFIQTNFLAVWYLGNEDSPLDHFQGGWTRTRMIRDFYSIESCICCIHSGIDSDSHFYVSPSRFDYTLIFDGFDSSIEQIF